MRIYLREISRKRVRCKTLSQQMAFRHIAVHQKIKAMSSSNISAQKAKEYINYYRHGLPAASLKSVLLNNEFIDRVIALSQTRQLNGVRIYLAKYSEDDQLKGVQKDDVTMIIVPTEEGILPGAKDIEDAYYNYGQLCPPHCKDDEGD